MYLNLQNKGETVKDRFLWAKFRESALENLKRLLVRCLRVFEIAQVLQRSNQCPWFPNSKLFKTLKTFKSPFPKINIPNGQTTENSHSKTLLQISKRLKVDQMCKIMTLWAQVKHHLRLGRKRAPPRVLFQKVTSNSHANSQARV